MSCKKKVVKPYKRTKKFKADNDFLSLEEKIEEDLGTRIKVRKA